MEIGMADQQTGPMMETEERMGVPGENGQAEAAAEEIDPAEVLEEDLTALMQRLQEQEQVAAENHDKFLRAMAEFDNYRKRTRQEIEDARRAGAERLAADLLPALDNFERALQHTDDEAEEDPVREGILLIHKQLLGTLAKHEIVPIEAGPDQEPGTVIEELRRGYTIGDRVLRASLVKVAGD
jgi:molecular chaperone GrpE